MQHLQLLQMMTKRSVCLIWHAIHPGKEILLLSQRLQLHADADTDAATVNTPTIMDSH